MRTLLQIFVGAGVCALISACGLSIAGAPDESTSEVDAAAVGPDGGPYIGEPAKDGSATADGPSTPTGCNADACALPAAGGFALALYGDPTDACPSGFTPTEVIENPTAGAAACDCGACTATINCSTGPVPTYFDNGGGACGSIGTQHQTNAGACRNTTGSFGANASVGAPTAVVGTCSAPAITSRAAVTSTPKRVCTREPATCPDDACTPAGSLKACLVANGDVACPGSAPTKHLVGADFTLDCAACGCQLSVTCGGKMDFFPDPNCNNNAKTLNVGVCTPTASTDFKSTKWTATPTQTCTKQPAPAVVALTGPQTVCCP